ncbi:TonB-dependent receptor plug domain-containing protein [Paremcibacter congregatus]|uniref:TonB-dependent receptor n=1 Tax=Paremcibacter congregatus TaxID=2043170 RepID=A0A2G4YQX2_9PROT|nr:TonB-dependent receptor [Paremcibacter congregatus]PHZ84708.1 TonB-dependent receptor [Paremcibacter congregatus]QDE28903.1 TonB-dependent receptor [Paremcibacter congregatus]
MKNTLLLLTSVSMLGMASVSYQAMAEEDAAAGEMAAIDEIVTIGTRRAGRTVTDSAVAIDILQPKAIESTGYTDLNTALRTLIPGFNAKRLHGNDGSSFVRPVTLRSSPPDHILLLMNGQRRHRSATVQIGTGHATTSGSQGQDFNTIPSIAFKSVEVLRDGAAAQYGSDAIAGVINMTLKDANEGGSVTAHAGQFYEGDGETFDLQANLGLPLSANGFINLSAQYNNQNKTQRVGTHVGAQALREAGVQGVPTPATSTGEPEYEAIKTAWNGGLKLNDTMDLYFFGNYMKADSTVVFGYRQSVDGGGRRAHAAFADSNFDQTAAYPDVFDLTTIYPGGFTPAFSGKQKDFSSVIGVKNEEEDGLNWDLSFRWGKNDVDYGISGTINPSLGAASPTSFKPGSLAQREYQLNAEASYDVKNNIFYSDLTVFGGVTYRDEAYSIGAGELASYTAGPLRDLLVGSNGFQGFSPDIAGTFSSHSYAVYMELEADITEKWVASAAVRYEDYEAFGDNFSYKVASKFDVSDYFAVRGAISTGFRAPAGGQQFGASQTSQLTLTGDFILDAVLIPGSPAAQVFGSTQLKPETSFNMSAGLVMTTDIGLAVTLDFYQIDVDDRLLLNDSINTTQADRDALVAMNFPNGASVQQVRFFQNRLDTRVRGFDLVTTYALDWADSDSSTDFNLAVNYNQQILRSDPTGIFSPGKVIEFEEGIPSWNGNLTVTHHVGDFDLMVRGVYYGAWKRRGIAADLYLPRDAEILMDVQVTYQVNENLSAHLGGRNIFDKYPKGREAAIFDPLGIKYDNHAVFGLSGGYYYAGMKYNF